MSIAARLHEVADTVNTFANTSLHDAAKELREIADELERPVVELGVYQRKDFYGGATADRIVVTSNSVDDDGCLRTVALNGGTLFVQPYTIEPIQLLKGFDKIADLPPERK